MSLDLLLEIPQMPAYLSDLLFIKAEASAISAHKSFAKQIRFIIYCAYILYSVVKFWLKIVYFLYGSRMYKFQ